jgi:hypothetical protein
MMAAAMTRMLKVDAFRRTNSRFSGASVTDKGKLRCSTLTQMRLATGGVFPKSKIAAVQAESARSVC